MSPAHHGERRRCPGARNDKFFQAPVQIALVPRFLGQPSASYARRSPTTRLAGAGPPLFAGTRRNPDSCKGKRRRRALAPASSQKDAEAVDDFLVGAGMPTSNPVLLSLDAVKDVLGRRGLERRVVDLAMTAKLMSRP